MRLFVGDFEERTPAFVRESFQTHRYPNGKECIALRAPSRPLEVVKAILKTYDGPLKFLYVLLKFLDEDFPDGRYLSPELDRAQAMDILDRFGSFLVDDARQEFWFITPTPFQIVCDIHERIWLYGDIATFRLVLLDLGIPEEPIDSIPVPHIHQYVKADRDQGMDILSLWEWSYSPLLERDGE